MEKVSVVLGYKASRGNHETSLEKTTNSGMDYRNDILKNASPSLCSKMGAYFDDEEQKP